jgi:hypothetical protein
MCTTLMALGVFGLLVLIAGAYHRPDPPAAEVEAPAPSHAPPGWLFVLVTVLGLLFAFLMILNAPEG